MLVPKCRIYQKNNHTWQLLFVMFKMRKLSGYSFHLNLMTEGENDELSIVL